MRKMYFFIPKAHWNLIKGVYRITVGGKFYIGSAQNLQARMYSHQNSLDRAMKLYPQTKQTCCQHYKWCPYIFENEGIKILHVNVIRRCVKDSELYYAEQFYLNEYAGIHPDCLNVSKEVPKPAALRGGVDKKWDCAFGEGPLPYFFDPDDKENTITSTGTPLRKDGKVSKAAIKRREKEVVANG